MFHILYEKSSTTHLEYEKLKLKSNRLKDEFDFHYMMSIRTYTK